MIKDMLLDVSDLRGDSQYFSIAWGEMTWVVLLSMSDSIGYDMCHSVGPIHHWYVYKAHWDIEIQ